MKVTELRLGDWVRIKDAPTTNEWQVESIGNLQQVGGQLWSIEELEPIPLTEEWLIKFGFEKDEEYDEGGLVDYRMTLMSGSLEFVSFWNSEEITGVNQPQTGVDVEYVHTLQNLYQSLTGEELTIKEPA